MDEPIDEPMRKPDMKDISDAAEQAAGEAEMSGRAQVFLDCDPDYRQVKITVGSNFRAWNPKGTETYCTEYTRRTVPLTAVYLHEMVHEEPRRNANAAKDKISGRWKASGTCTSGTTPRSPEVIPRSVEDFNWAARTAHGIHGKRTV